MADKIVYQSGLTYFMTNYQAKAVKTFQKKTDYETFKASIEERMTALENKTNNIYATLNAQTFGSE